MLVNTTLVLAPTLTVSMHSTRRSLSEVPKGLRPIRTTSGRAGAAAAEDEEQQVKGFVKRLRWARQQALRQTGKQHATQPTPARVSLLIQSVQLGACVTVEHLPGHGQLSAQCFCLLWSATAVAESG